MSTVEIDEAKLEEFMGQFVGDLGAAITAPLVLIGDKLGLYKAMADSEPVTPQELAERTDCRERYITGVALPAGGQRLRRVRRGHAYLQAPARAGDGAGRRRQPGVHPRRLSVVAATVKDEPQIAERFRSGEGFGWHEHHARPVRGHRAILPARLSGKPGGRLAARARRRARQAHSGRQGRGHRLRPRSVDDPDGQGVSGFALRWLGLPRGLHTSRPRGRRARGVSQTG